MCGAPVAAFARGCEACGENLSESSGPAGDRTKASERQPAISTGPTVVPRYIAATLDNAIAMVVGVAAAKIVDDGLPAIQVGVMVVAYLAYYVAFGGAIGRTPGKLLTGLVVVAFDGARCSWRQALVRTAFRLLEVNPLLLGGLPAAVRIVWSRHHQRFGDRIADTVVVHIRRVPPRSSR